MTHRVLVTSLLIAVAQGVQTIEAQTVAELKAGARVRVTAANGKARVGEFAQITADSIQFVDWKKQTNVRLAVSSLAKLELSQGDKRARSARRGALIGLVAGTLVGVVGGTLGYREPECSSKTEFCVYAPSCTPFCTRASSVAADAVFFGASGAYLGFSLGRRRGEKWTVIDLHTR